jgi:hypothetical protein
LLYAYKLPPKTHAHIVRLEAAFDAFDLAHRHTVSDLI